MCTIPTHCQKCLIIKKYKLSLKNFKNSEKYGKFNISLPVYPKLKKQEIDNICKEIIKLVVCIKKNINCWWLWFYWAQFSFKTKNEKK